MRARAASKPARSPACSRGAPQQPGTSPHRAEQGHDRTQHGSRLRARLAQVRATDQERDSAVTAYSGLMRELGQRGTRLRVALPVTALARRHRLGREARIAILGPRRVQCVSAGFLCSQKLVQRWQRCSPSWSARLSRSGGKSPRALSHADDIFAQGDQRFARFHVRHGAGAATKLGTITAGLERFLSALQQR